MIEIIGEFIKLFANFINWFFTLYIDFDGTKVSVGQLALVFIFILVSIWCFLYAIGVYGKDWSYAKNTWILDRIIPYFSTELWIYLLLLRCSHNHIADQSIFRNSNYHFNWKNERWKMVDISKFLLISQEQFNNLILYLHLNFDQSNENYLLTYLFTNFLAYFLIIIFIVALLWCYRLLFSKRARSWI